jgi:hypothetical protein
MPTASEILATLGTISNEMLLLAVIWHVLLGLTVVAVLAGWRPARRTGAVGLTLPLLSVSLMAWIYRNPFNGIVFLVFAVILATMGGRLLRLNVGAAPAWARIVGVLMFVFGWVYPHFLGPGAGLKYLYGAPTGLIPCPTLSVVTGLALLARGFGSRAWSVVLAVLGLFYAAFGVFRLGVRLDFALGLGAAALLVQALTLRPSPVTRLA